MALAVRCSACSTELRAGAKFCDNCARPVGPGAGGADAVPGPPSDVTQRILETRASIEGERKQVTVLFADVKGSMNLQADLDAEEWARIMARFLEILAAGVHRFEGTVDKFTGDGIMALFGAPIAFEDHARRACHAALHLAEAVRQYAEELWRTHGLSFHMRQGLNSGDVVVGRIGDDAHMEYTAIGTTVGLAQRMEALAQPDKMYLTEATARLVTGFFRLNDLGDVPVKGMSHRVHAFALEGVGPLRSGLDVARQRGLSRFVGRDDEMAILESAFEQAMSGNAQVVGVVGEAGVGKSRICDEFSRECLTRGVTVLRARGVSHGTNVPYLPVLELLRNYFGITDVDTPRQAREKIAGRLLLIDASFEEELALFFDLLEVPDPDRPGPQLGEEARLRRVFSVVRRLARRRTERDEGLLVLLEDLHWLDGPSRQFFEQYVESYPGTRTLVLANFRPEFHAPWMRHSYYRQIALAPLGRDAVNEMISNVVGNDLSLVGFADHVIARTAGNPFFVEEVIRMLLDEGALEGPPGEHRLVRPLQQLRVPATVQALLASRIDRLDPSDKHVLQTASVVGINFSESVVAQVTGYPEETSTASLHTLCASEFLVDEAPGSRSEYRFWHPLTQEVAYRSLLSERRAQLHERVARALIELEPDRLNELAALIANHFDAAGEALHTARWNVRAADWALRTNVGEALLRWRRAIDVLEGLSAEGEALDLGLRARHRLARWGARADMPQREVDQILDDATELAQRTLNTTALANIVFARGAISLYRGNVSESRVAVLEAVRLADSTQDVGLRTAARVAPPVVYGVTGPIDEGLAMANEGVSMAEEDPNRGFEHLGYHLLARHLCTRAFLLARAGRLADAVADADRALAIARERGESEILGWTIAAYPLIAFLAGDQGDTVALAQEAVRVAADTGNVNLRPLVLCSQGLAQLNNGAWNDAIRSCELAVRVAREHSVWLFEEGSLLTFSALAHLGAGDRDGAARRAEDAVLASVARQTPVLECGALVVRSQVRRHEGSAHPQACVADLERATRLITETGAEAWRPFIHLEYAGLAGLDRDETRRERELEESARLFERTGATGHVARVRRELGR